MQLFGARTCSSYRGVPSDDEIFRQGRAGEDDGRGCDSTVDKQRVRHGSEGDRVAAGVVEPTPPLTSHMAMIHPNLRFIRRINHRRLISNVAIKARKNRPLSLWLEILVRRLID
ncbi:hypothetical protein TIFTF001_017670 [Ficus carica]|uniref:Uncharacterized protein n=1 Tax=Ficus carica TaxID=3494 RepID=A0AA88DAZ6_FICCA|nr:hypothetical protein TIFTF001_017670 [Ficus carica]